MAPRNPSPTDRTDQDWAFSAPDVPTAKPGDRPETSPQRDILDASCSLLRGGWAGRLLPPEFPPWPIVAQDGGRWRNAGPWQRRHDRRRGDVRVAAGTPRHPRAGRRARQSVKPTEPGGATATTSPNRSTAVNGPSAARPSGCAARSWSPPPAGTTVPGRCPGWTAGGTAGLACA